MVSFMTRSRLFAPLMLLCLLVVDERAEAQQESDSLPSLEVAPAQALAKPGDEPEKAVSGGPKPGAPATKEPPPVKLDLSLPEEVVEQLEPLEPAADSRLLPQFFEQEGGREFFELHGRLLTNEQGDDWQESLDGAELRFEFKR